jgi:hypothetical protein
MTNLPEVLSRFVSAGPAMGPDANDVQRLRDDLAAVIRRSTTFFLIPFVSYAILLMLVVAGFIIWRSEPIKIGGILGVAGISIPFLIRGIQSMWCAKLQAEMLLALAATLDPAVLGSIAKTLLKNISDKKK